MLHSVKSNLPTTQPRPCATPQPRREAAVPVRLEFPPLPTWLTPPTPAWFALRAPQVNTVSQEGSTVLSSAATRGDLDGVRRAQRRGADVNMPTPDGRAPLHWAASSMVDNCSVIIELCENTQGKRCGADVNARTPVIRTDEDTLTGGESPLHTLMLCCDDPVPAMRYLVAQGADIDVCAANGATPLWTAAMWRRGRQARDSLDMFEQARDVMAPMHESDAASDSSDRLNVIAALLADGANPHLRCGGYTLAETIIKSYPGRARTLMLLLRHGVSADSMLQQDSYVAAAAGRFVDALARHDTRRATGYKQILVTLLEAGADPYASNDLGVSPLSRIFRAYPRQVRALEEVLQGHRH